MAPIGRRAIDERPVLALSGGVGGAKLALGLAPRAAARRLTVVANTGDDFEHLGLHISPDLDTLIYTLAGLDNPETGWGRRDETWTFMAALEELGGETWFRLGDGDLATHVERTRRLKAGETLSAITDDVARRLGIASRILPMTDDPVRTRLRPARACSTSRTISCGRAMRAGGHRLRLRRRRDRARRIPMSSRRCADPGLRAVIICPSNPFISIDPILALPGVRQALAACRGAGASRSRRSSRGRAVKGPTAKMMTELGLPVDPLTVAAPLPRLPRRLCDRRRRCPNGCDARSAG